MFRFLLLLVAISFPLFLSAANSPSTPIKRVIYITLDGTRWQDIYNEKGDFKTLWEKYGKEGKFYGKPHTNSPIQVASVPISLPSYQSQMSGVVQPCEDNGCGKIKVETMPETILYRLGLAKHEVVTFASWKQISEAVEHRVGTIFTNIGNEPVVDPITHEADPIMAALNRMQSVDHPQNGDRYDQYTFAHAMHYFEKYQPKFMWISLTDADNVAHAEDKRAYYKTLAFYNNALDELFTSLKKMQMDKDTLVIVTTDHGRGKGKNWVTHGPDYPESKRTWAFVVNGQLVPVLKSYSTLSIKPTIETALNLEKKLA